MALDFTSRGSLAALQHDQLEQLEREFHKTKQYIRRDNSNNWYS